jgi:hypothetical protein
MLARPPFRELHEIARDALPLALRVDHQSVYHQNRNPVIVSE